jgi:hypothetical protein
MCSLKAAIVTTKSKPDSRAEPAATTVGENEKKTKKQET